MCVIIIVEYLGVQSAVTTVGHEDSIKILETVGYDVTGNIIYPLAQITNQDADDAESSAAADFIAYITNDEAKAL